MAITDWLVSIAKVFITLVFFSFIVYSFYKAINIIIMKIPSMREKKEKKLLKKLEEQQSYESMGDTE